MSRRLPTILIADDHPLLRLSVREEVEAAGFAVCADVDTAAQAVEAAIRDRPDLCVLDISMPGGGLSAAAEIRRRVPETRIVMLTASVREDDVLEALRSGASGYLLKDDDPTRLPIALRDVLNGIPAFPRRLSAGVVEAARSALGAPASA